MVVLVLGVNHGLQRHSQNGSPRCNRQRDLFAEKLRELLKTQNVTLLAEEACNDEAVARHLTSLFGRTVQPEEPIAKVLSREVRDCRHIDICPPDIRESENPQEYERQMVEAIVHELVPGDIALVICGETHRTNVAEQLQRRGINVTWTLAVENEWTGAYGVEN